MEKDTDKNNLSKKGGEHADPSDHGVWAESSISLWAGAASVTTAIILIILKGGVYLNNESVSVLATLIDSVIDASLSILTFYSIRLSLKPADEEHRHGHGKVEGVTAVVQAAFIAGSGLFLLLESMSRVHEPRQATHFGETMVVMVIAIILSLVLVFIQNMSLKRSQSLAIEADKAHYTTDIIINAGVIAVMAGLWYGLPLWIDPLFAVFVTIYMGLTAFKISQGGLDMLMDREVSEERRQKIRKIILVNEGVLGVHDLRATRSGMKLSIQFDVEMEPEQSLKSAHEHAKNIERALLDNFPNAEIMIHIDPQGDTEDSRHPRKYEFKDDEFANK